MSLSQPVSPLLPASTALAPRPGDRVVVGLSGGVDSAVSAMLLRDQGFEVIGVFMKNWEDDAACNAREDLVDAASVADCLGIEIDAVNFSAEYQQRVFAYFLAEYQAGRTPNPDILCNTEIKFRAFLEHAFALGADWVATGHYARARRSPAGTELLRGLDTNKDQSYFLHRLSQAQIRRVLFPVGELPKPEVRALARAAGLPVHAKRDSTGICFIGERPFREFLGRYLKGQPGPMQTPQGRVVGEHQGLMFHTLGQRQGLGIGGPGEPWYVAGKDLERNVLIVVQGHDHPALLCQQVELEDCAWINGSTPTGAGLSARLRYRQEDLACTLTELGAGSVRLQFGTPQWAVTPGQFGVLYRGEVCLGGGVIR
ncbi:MAG: tRNA 2-thiouridine(34) synthase MnmA [Pseudomonadota bacterium]|nr:tRNA 2-thiouridine(34) synthase MnmA [Pseudomonadota bacterium]